MGYAEDVEAARRARGVTLVRGVEVPIAMATPPPGTSQLSPGVAADRSGQQFMLNTDTGQWEQLGYQLGGQGPLNVVSPNVYRNPVTGAVVEGAGSANEDATARARPAQLLSQAMRGLPFMSQDYLGALSAGQTPAPRTLTPQTLAALAGDEFLSSNFFALLEAAGLYPTNYLAEVARFQPPGAAAA